MIRHITFQTLKLELPLASQRHGIGILKTSNGDVYE